MRIIKIDSSSSQTEDELFNSAQWLGEDITNKAEIINAHLNLRYPYPQFSGLSGRYQLSAVKQVA